MRDRERSKKKDIVGEREDERKSESENGTNRARERERAQQRDDRSGEAAGCKMAMTAVEGWKDLCCWEIMCL